MKAAAVSFNGKIAFKIIMKTVLSISNTYFMHSECQRPELSKYQVMDVANYLTKCIWVEIVPTDGCRLSKQNNTEQLITKKYEIRIK